MTSHATYEDVTVDVDDDYVATVTIHRPPNNFFDYKLVASIRAAFEDIDDNPDARAIVLGSEGKHFCAGGDFMSPEEELVAPLYRDAIALFAFKTPVVARVQGAAIGGGIGLAMVCDFRVAAPEARFSANFSLLGFHHGMGLTVTLPRAVGHQVALEVLYTGRRFKGEEAYQMGLCDELVPLDRLEEAAHRRAATIAAAAPLSIRAIRETMRGDLHALVRAAAGREAQEQYLLETTNDFDHGVSTYFARETPHFTGT